jgi:SAM-dependent methyltransferase
VLDRPAEDAEALLSGRALDEIGIHGAVESDFFDWVLEDQAGHDLVRRLARQAARFRLRDVQSDVLKALYESLMDPEQRHDLGEYYTPDWLAAKVTAAAMDAPLDQRVLDPACGSGTFLFHAIRRLRMAGVAAGWKPPRRVAACTAQVRGLDVHPVAVIIARVTWLLALGEDIHERDGAIHVPVFLGDALQWNISQVGDSREVRVNVPQEAQPLRVPAGFAEDQALLDAGVQALKDGLERDASAAMIERDLKRLPGASAGDAVALAATFGRILALHRAGRDGIWPFVLRNLVRPLWLSRADQRADVLLGNPPWVAYRHLSAPMQARMRAACQELNLWVGGVLATQQDLCALFTVRAVQRYLKPGGRVAFVLPYAVLNRPVFAGLRRGDHRQVQIAWDAGWSLDETVRPLFPVPASVMFGRRAACGVLPATVRRFEGALPRRDASEAEADGALRVEAAAVWPPIPTLAGASPYRARFKQGATIVPRRFWFVERLSGGRLGASQAAPLVRGRVGGQDKAPWKTVEPPHGPVERQFLRPLLLGESLAPFRVLAPALAVVPVDERGQVIDSSSARRDGFPRLADWLQACEGKWEAHAAKAADNASLKMSLSERLDHHKTLSQQFPVATLRVAYAKAGTMFAAAVVHGTDAVVDHMAYWTRARSPGEASYLVAILNCDRLRLRIEAMQQKGQGGARHFDNLIWELPIPDFDPRDPLHLDLATLAEEAERLAAAVELTEGAYFTTHRRAIRDALDAAGLSARLDALVARLPGM